MSEFIKTGNEIWQDVEYSGINDEPIRRKWVPVDFLQEKIIEKRKEYPCTTSGECIENISAKEVFAWLLTLLEG